VSRWRPGRARVEVTGGDSGGVVQVRDHGQVIGRDQVNYRGIARVKLPRLAPGRHRLRTRYLGTQSTMPKWSKVMKVVIR
jgi:hypothetical protein